jgi:hypothetical protein
MNVDDYYVVMVMLINNCFGYLCMISLGCKPTHVNQLKMANNLLNST